MECNGIRENGRGIYFPYSAALHTGYEIDVGRAKAKRCPPNRRPGRPTLWSTRGSGGD